MAEATIALRARADLGSVVRLSKETIDACAGTSAGAPIHAVSRDIAAVFLHASTSDHLGKEST